MLRSPTLVRLLTSTGLRNVKRLVNYDCFSDRHIGPSEMEKQLMLNHLGYKDLDQMTETNVPEAISLKRSLNLPPALDEWRMLTELRAVASKNEIFRSYIGMGYYDCIVPGVIVRNLLQSAGWLTSYTPYQPEIAQGRLESLLNFQTMISDLTGLAISNASLLDEATACAEAIALACRATKRQTILYDPFLHPQNIALLKTRAGPLNIKLEVLNMKEPSITRDIAGVILQYPNTEGHIYELEGLIEEIHNQGALCIMACDLLSLTLLRSPGCLKADIAIGNAQRFGLPLGYGGPHPGFMAVAKTDTRSSLARLMPGRIVGVSKDVDGNKAYRLALQTREQHIRRDKATSNICTAQALPANMAAMYAVYHGPNRLAQIARTIHKSTAYLAQRLTENGIKPVYDEYFDTIKIKPKNITDFRVRCEQKKINVRHFTDGHVGVSLDETVLPDDLSDILHLFEIRCPSEQIESELQETPAPLIGNSEHQRRSTYLTHPVFNSHHSESQLVRYIKRLENKDISLVHSMIPLGSCTMKLNASAELTPMTWPQFSTIHPFAPIDQCRGYYQIFNDLERWLCELTGYDSFSLQPNSIAEKRLDLSSGANGEYAALLAIKQYLESIDQSQRKVVLIPNSAHGTNPASAQAEKYKDELAAVMLTYPSTHGVFESSIVDVCNRIHEAGGQVFLDGANFNAQVGLCRPGDYGSDVSHLNLHKTFCIPHGGGGPDKFLTTYSHLAPFLPGHPVIPRNGHSEGAVAAAPWGSSSILTITWAYIRLMGAHGLRTASQMAILNANYMAKRLEEGGYRVVYKGEQGLNAHDFHAPTMAWPVHDCLMIEPTESEDKGEMDRFVDSMLQIYEEIQKIETGEYDRECNPLRMAPHTLRKVLSSDWDRPYSRETAAFPKPWCYDKTWPTVARIDDQYGDRNLVCSCPPIDSYRDA
ncbi:hypothetical protein M3Y94_00934200 [Aphelenchoides besseyi]|nr:hypothetical protein M3Y94_00934200 [Aphelenchoides besseyi]